MDTLFYKILLLFVGLAFLFIQSKEFKSSKIHLVLLPQWKHFAGWLGSAKQLGVQSPHYPMHLLRINWQTLSGFSEEELRQFEQALTKKNQYLVVIFPVFIQECLSTLAVWKNLKTLPIRYCELSAAQTSTHLHNWTQTERTAELQNFQYFLDTLKEDFPSMQYFAWGAFANPSTPTEVFWNMLLGQFQRYWQGYVVVVKNPTPDHFQALARVQFPVAVHLHSQTESMAQWLEDFLFILNGIQHLPLVYLSQQEHNAEVPAADKLLARLLWRNPRWQGINLLTESSKPLESVYAWHWQKDWDTGLILINKSNQKQKINTATFFPSFFYQELFYEDTQAVSFKVLAKDSQGFHQVELPPQSIAFLSSTALPSIAENNWIANFQANLQTPTTLVLQYQLLEDSSRIDLRLFDFAGNEIYHWHKEALKAGFYQMHYQAEALSEGSYLCSLVLEGKNFIYEFDFFPSQI